MKQGGQIILFRFPQTDLEEAPSSTRSFKKMTAIFLKAA
jgi:hypothetical protein